MHTQCLYTPFLTKDKGKTLILRYYSAAQHILYIHGSHMSASIQSYFPLKFYFGGKSDLFTVVDFSVVIKLFC